VSNVNELVLKKEIALLESKLSAAERTLKIQDELVNGFCRVRLEAASRKPARPTK